MKKLVKSAETYEGLDNLQRGLGDLSMYINEALRVASEMYFASEQIAPETHRVLDRIFIPMLDGILEGRTDKSISTLREAIQTDRYGKE